VPKRNGKSICFDDDACNASHEAQGNKTRVRGLRIVTALNEPPGGQLGTCLRGATYAISWLTPNFNGVLLWSRPSQSDIRQLTEVLDTLFRGRQASFSLLIDVRHLSAFEVGGFF
jgi:hypothetical protein